MIQGLLDVSKLFYFPLREIQQIVLDVGGISILEHPSLQQLDQMDNSSIDQGQNIVQAIKLNREIATRISNLKRKCFQYKVQGPIQLSQRSNGSGSHTFTMQNVNNMLKFAPEEQEVIIKELSCRLNIQGLTVEQFLTGRTEISQHQLVVILINKLKYPNQFSARRTARLIFQLTIYDTEEKRQIDDVLFEFKGRLECSSYSRQTGKQLFQKLGLKIRNVFYRKIVNKNLIDYHTLTDFLFSEGLDVYQTNQLMSYILECSPTSNFHSLELKCMLIKEQEPHEGGAKKDRYEKKQSILTKSSQNRDRESSPARFGKDQQISFLDCEVEVVVEEHEHHKCGVYDCQYQY